MSTIDLGIIALYLVSIITIGIVLQKKAAQNIDSYLLGGKTLPWYMLGLSNASGMFDISGTMWMVSLAFVYGLKSIWIPWLWPVFNQIFLMIFLGVWLRRSNVLTGAEWIRTRFGDGKGGTLSHIIVVIFALLSVIGFLSYGFIGIGKFIAIFMPWDIDPRIYGMVFTAIATVYVMLGGMFSIVWTDVLQFTIMTVSGILIAWIALDQVDAATLKSMVPDNWYNPFFGWNLDLDWSNQLPEVNNQIMKDGYGVFGIFFMMMAFKGILASLAGPAPNYDLQKILATKSPKEAAKMSFFVNVVLFPSRYLMIFGFAILAIVFFRDEFLQMGSNLDFEQILPMAIQRFVPVGLKGLLLAGLLAAFMSTFAATVNAAPAYVVNDIYRRYINPNADTKRLIGASYIISVFAVVISTFFGFYVESVNDVLQWIVSALYGGFAAANLLKFFWWRFNGHGFFWGMATGILAAMVFPQIFPDTLELYYFPLLFGVSLTGCIAGTLLGEPTPDDVLIDFYFKVRPWGFWKPVLEKAKAKYPNIEANKEAGRDWFNILIGVVWQTSLTALPIFVVVEQTIPLFITIAVLVVTSLVLKFNWWNKLEDWPQGVTNS